MIFKEFKDLCRCQDQRRGLPDQLNYALAVDDHTIALKDGSFLVAFECAVLDLNSASTEELDAHRSQANRALARLDDGFMYNVDLIRYPSVDYPARAFPDPVSTALEREREIQYSTEGSHLETRCVIGINYRHRQKTKLGLPASSSRARRLAATARLVPPEAARVRRRRQPGLEADRACGARAAVASRDLHQWPYHDDSATECPDLPRCSSGRTGSDCGL
jgi:type IV secretory pathway VirB4 component